MIKPRRKVKQPTKHGSTSCGEVALHPNDVLFGRGPKICSHEGNVRYSCFVRQYKNEYQASRKPGKPLVIAKLKKKIESLKPPGRFLEVKGDNYVLVGGERIYEKISQALRDKKYFHPDQDIGNVKVEEGEEQEHGEEEELGGHDEELGGEELKRSAKNRQAPWKLPLTVKEASMKPVPIVTKSEGESEEFKEEGPPLAIKGTSAKGRTCATGRSKKADKIKETNSIHVSKGEKRKKRKAFGRCGSLRQLKKTPCKIEEAVEYESRSFPYAPWNDQEFELFTFPVECESTFENGFLGLDAGDVFPLPLALPSDPVQSSGSQFLNDGLAHPETDWDKRSVVSSDDKDIDSEWEEE